MNIIPLDTADFDLVAIKTTNNCAPTPHCMRHGAMNKITLNEDGGGIQGLFRQKLQESIIFIFFLSFHPFIGKGIKP